MKKNKKESGHEFIKNGYAITNIWLSYFLNSVALDKVLRKSLAYPFEKWDFNCSLTMKHHILQIQITALNTGLIFNMPENTLE